MKKTFFFTFLTISIMFFIFILLLNKLNKNTENSILKKVSNYSKIERKIINSIPIYEDYNKNGIENELRKYLLKDHIKIAKKIGIPPITTIKEINFYQKNNLLSFLDLTKKDNYFFYNVSKQYRYLTPVTLKGLQKVCFEIQKTFQNFTNLKTTSLKIAISSALRPIKYQRNLRKKNKNASIISSHSYGTSFDIFYDDFYLSLPKPNKNEKNKTISKIRQKFGFILGDSLRRQFKTVLHKSLVKLQQKGLLYAIHEKKQRCYHITIRR